MADMSSDMIVDAAGWFPTASRTQTTFRESPMSADKYPSIEYVRQCLRYEDGRLFWRNRVVGHFSDERAWRIWNTRWAHKEAGCLVNRAKHPQWLIRIDRVHFLRHILVWAIHHGEWRLGIDHKDRDPLNDRIGNLRSATQSQNLANQSISSVNKSGYKGVSWDKTNRKWRAVIMVEKKYIHLGRFDDPAMASEAYMEAARKYFGEFASTGA